MDRLEKFMAISDIPADILADHLIDVNDLEVQLGQPEKWIKLYVVFTPLLWLTGALLPASLLLLIWLLLRIPARKYLTDWVVLSWWMVSAAQIVSVFFNWVEFGEGTAFLLRQLLSFTTTGWVVLGAALAVGKYSRLDYKELIRAASILCLYFIIFTIISIPLYLTLGDQFNYIAVPFGLLLPNDMSLTKFYFTIHLYMFDDLYNVMLPRLVFFYPWPLCLSFAGIGLLFMAFQEDSKWWKYVGITGALIGIAGSMGRMGILALVGCILVYLGARLSTQAKWLLVPVLSVFLIVSLLSGWGERFVSSELNAVEASRQGSTDARNLAYEMTWQAILKSPVIGYGWVGENISEEIPIPLGSHSTIFGLLYTGGVVTFSIFCLAAALTLATLLKRLTTMGNIRCLSALCIFLALLMFAVTEGINYFFISTLIILFWIGAALSTTPDQDNERRLILLV